MVVRARTFFLVLCCALGAVPYAGRVAAQPQSVTISSINVDGNATTDSSLIVATSRLRPGASVTIYDIQEAVKKLYSLGIFADVQVLTTGESAEGIDLVVRVEEYPTIEDIKFSGNEEIDLDKIKEEVALVVGQVVSPLDIRRTRDKIRGLYREKGYYLAKVEVQERLIEADNRVLLEFAVEEGKKIRIREIAFNGNDHIQAKKLRKVMETKEKRWYRKGDFKKDEFRDDLKRIVALYQQYGYRDAEVTGHEIGYDEAMEYMLISITVDEGVCYRMGMVNWTGNKVYSRDELQKGMMLAQGDVLDMMKYHNSQVNLYKLYREKGFIYAEIEPREEVVDSVVNVTYHIREGMPARVRRIEIRGNNKTREKVIRRELVLKPGDTFRLSAMERSQREIYQLNYFSNVEIDHKEVAPGQIDIIFDVEEKPAGRASLGAGYGTDGLVGTIGITEPNVLGTGQNLDFNWDFSSARQSFNVSYTEPWLLDTPTSAGMSVYNIVRTQDIDLYQYQRRTGSSIKLGRTRIPGLDYVKLFGKYTIERIVGVEDDDISWLSAIGVNAIRDSRDLPEFATKGSYASYYLQLAGGILLGDEDFHKHELNMNYYFPTIWKLVLNPALTLGYIEGWGAESHAEVPDREKFRPGGRSTDGMVRGYADQSLRPTEDSYGGRLLTVFNLEYRFPLVEQTFYGLLFYDAGNTYMGIGDFDASELQHGTGFGFRAAIPMLGTLGFDFGYRLTDPVPDFWDNWEMHFQFGRLF